MNRRSRWGFLLVLALVAAGVVLVLRQTSMFDDDSGPAHMATRMVVHVRYQQGKPATDVDTNLLWRVCAVNIPGERVARSVAHGTVTATMAPALGDDVQRRFVGCLQDLTLPAMLGQVISTRTVPVPPALADGTDRAGPAPPRHS